MKKIIYIVTEIILMASCNQIEFKEMNDSDCLVAFNLIGEITSSDTPMTKVSSGDLYLIQVNIGNAYYASAIYDDPSAIKINLKKGSQYRIIMSVIKDGKNRIEDKYSATNNSVCTPCSRYYYKVNNSNHVNDVDNGSLSWFYDSWSNGSRELWLPINQGFYNSVNVYYYYSDQTSTNILTTTDLYYSNYTGFKYIEYAKLWSDKYPECYDWYYGEINNYSPTGQFETLSMDLKRVGFKLKYELSGVTDGEVTVKVYNNTKTFIENTTSTATYASDPQFFAFYDVHSAWQYADDYMENFTLAVSWKRDTGQGYVTEDYGTKTIQIKRNCLNNIKINLGSNDQSAGLSMTVESESTIGAESVTIPVE